MFTTKCTKDPWILMWLSRKAGNRPSKHVTRYNLESFDLNVILERQMMFCWECGPQIYWCTFKSQTECRNTLRSLLSLTAFPTLFTVESITRLPYLHLFLALRQGTVYHIVGAVGGVEGNIEEVSFWVLVLLMSKEEEEENLCFYSFIYSNSITRHCQERK